MKRQMDAYFFFDNTNTKEQSYMPYNLEDVKAKFEVRESRVFGDFDVFLKGYKIGHLFSNVDKFNEHLSVSGF